MNTFIAHYCLQYQMASRTTMYGLDPSKYPARMGQPWKEEEVVKLLTSIQKEKTVEEIAKAHERTVGSIQAYIRKLAADYYFNDNRSIEEIQKFTRLTCEEIEEVIQKHETNKETKKATAAVKTTKVAAEKTSAPDVITLLKDVQSKLNLLVVHATDILLPIPSSDTGSTAPNPDAKDRVSIAIDGGFKREFVYPPGKSRSELLVHIAAFFQGSDTLSHA
jgi:hypothetical protein